MIRKDLVAALRAHTGPLYLDVNNRDDGFWFQGVKSDVIAQMNAKFQPDEETGFTVDADGYFGKDYSA